MVELSGNVLIPNMDICGGIVDLISMFQPIPDGEESQETISGEPGMIPCVLPPALMNGRAYTTTGPIPSCKSNTFLTIYSLSEQQLYYNHPVIFDKHDAIDGDCDYHSFTGKIWVWRPGYYYVYTSIYHLEACQFALIKNGAIVRSSVVGSLTGTSQNTNSFILEIGEKDMIAPFSKNTPYQNCACVLRLINYSSSMYVTLVGSNSSGNRLPQITASFTMMRIR